MEKTKNKRRLFKLLTGFVVGSAVGSILGLSLAPKRGEEMREMIRDKSMDLFLKSKARFQDPKEVSEKKQEMSPFKKRLVQWLTPKNKRP